MWDEATIRREEPNLSPNIKRALFAPTAGVVNPYEMIAAVVNSSRKNGVDLYVNCIVEGIEKKE